MAETIFAGKQIKELACEYRFGDFRPANKKVPWLFKDCFMGNRPYNGCYWQCQQKKSCHLFGLYESG